MIVFGSLEKTAMEAALSVYCAQTKRAKKMAVNSEEGHKERFVDTCISSSGIKKAAPCSTSILLSGQSGVGGIDLNLVVESEPSV